MTREEAIEILQTGDFPQYYTIREVKQALNMAIQALSAPDYDCSNCKWYQEVIDGDLISRDFMNKLGATCIAKRSETGELVAISSIDNLPSVE